MQIVFTQTFYLHRMLSMAQPSVEKQIYLFVTHILSDLCIFKRAVALHLFNDEIHQPPNQY